MSRFLSFFLLLVWYLPLNAQALNVSISSKGAILVSPENGAVLYEKNADLPLQPASIVKTATALFVIERKMSDLQELVTVSKEAVRVENAYKKQADIENFPSYLLEHDGAKFGLLPGEKVTVETLLGALLTASANDAANSLAEHVSGSIDNFVYELNAFLKEIGCQNTHLTNPHGLYHPRQLTTARDMALIATRAMQNSLFRRLCQQGQFDYPESNKRPGGSLYHTNRLIRKGKFFYPAALGIKTGYTASAGHNIVAAAEREGRFLIAVCMGGKESALRYQDVISLFDTAFKEKKTTRPLFSAASSHFKEEIKAAKKPLIAGLKEDIEISYYPSEEPELTPEIIWSLPPLPINKGAYVGELRLLKKEGAHHASYPLFAKEKVEKRFWSWGKLIWIVPLFLLLFLRRKKPIQGKKIF